MKDQPFLTDVKTLRKRAREHIKKGAVTSGYAADLDTVIKLLNEALATEIVCPPIQVALLYGVRHYCSEHGGGGSSTCQ